MPPDSTNSPPKHRPCVLKPYAHKPGPKNQKIKGPKTSAFSNVPFQRNNLTLHDWLQVVDWYDHHQPISQAETVKYLKNLHDDALLFNQGTLSCHLIKKGHELDQAKLASTPTALSPKHAQIVTWPDVEEALQLWVQHMEKKWETVTGAMLVEKCAQFEDALNVPEQERLWSEGWVQKLLQTWVWNVTENEGNSWF